jgi:hypothetical protein
MTSKQRHFLTEGQYRENFFVRINITIDLLIFLMLFY